MPAPAAGELVDDEVIPGFPGTRGAVEKWLPAGGYKGPRFGELPPERQLTDHEPEIVGEIAGAPAATPDPAAAPAEADAAAGQVPAAGGIVEDVHGAAADVAAPDAPPKVHDVEVKLRARRPCKVCGGTDHDGRRHRGDAKPAPPRPLASEEEIESFSNTGVAQVRRKIERKTTTLSGRVRSQTIAPKRLTRDERAISGLAIYPDDVERPLMREHCSQMSRPCPFVSCSHHLYLDVNPETGAIKLNFPHLEVWEMTETCSLDVADRGGITLEEVGAILNLTRERIRQVEVRGLCKIKNDDTGGELGVMPEWRRD